MTSIEISKRLSDMERVLDRDQDGASLEFVVINLIEIIEDLNKVLHSQPTPVQS